MARVEIAAQAWGLLLDRTGTGQSGVTVTLETLAGATVPTYTTASGTTAATKVTDTAGRIPGWVEAGTYVLGVGDDETTVEAATGSPGGTSSPLTHGADRLGVSDSTAAFTAAIAESSHVVVPPGKYLVNLNVVAVDNLTIEGAGSSTVLHNTTASDDALYLQDCDDLTVKNLRVQGTSGTYDGLSLKNCQRARVERVYCLGTGRYGIKAVRCFGIVVDQCACGPDTVGPYSTGVAVQLSGLVLTWDGSAADSGCNGAVVNGGFYVIGQSQEWALVVDHADNALINGPITELSGGGIHVVDSRQVVINGYYGEANPSDVEYATGTASVTNGLTAVTGSGTAWSTNDGEGHPNAWKNKYLIVGTSLAKISVAGSATALTLQEVWPGSTAAGTAYRIQSVDLLLENTKDSTVTMGRGGAAIFLKNADRNTIVGSVCESLFVDANSAGNNISVTTNNVSAGATRIVNNGTLNTIRQWSWQDGSAGLNRETGFKQHTAATFIDPAPGVACSVKVSDNFGTDHVYLGEQSSDPSAPPADIGVLYTRDNGAGKTQLVCRFSSGAIQVVATQP